MRPVNQRRKYYNFEGKLPPIEYLPAPAEIPPQKPGDLPKLLTDTTMRDGSQDPRFALFPPEAKIQYFDLLHELDNGTGRIAMVETFIYQKRDLWVLEGLLERHYEYPQVTAWTRATPQDIKYLVQASKGRIKETGMLVSASDHHIFDKIRFQSKSEAVEKYLEPILTAYKEGITPRIHLEDTTKADIYGWVIPFMERVLEETNGQAKFRICDTLGIGVPDPWAALPMGLPHLFSTLVKETGAELEFHGHNDFGLCIADSITAFIYGAKKVNCTFGGVGERTGNASLEQMMANYIRMYGDPGFKLEVLDRTARLFQENVVALPSNQPLIGDVFATQAGIHQAGVERQKDADGGLIYLPFDPGLIGRLGHELNRIGSLSGADGIAAVLNKQLALETGREGQFTKDSPVVKYLYDKIQEAYDGEYHEVHGEHWNGRRSFFDPLEILALARSFQKDLA